MKSFRALVAATAAVAAAFVLSSCTSPASDGHTDHEHSAETSAAAAALPAGVNDADVAFVTGMIPHHQQAVEMSAMVPGRSTNPAVVKLAADISAAQGPEIEIMKALEVQWTAGRDEGQGADEGDAGHDGHDMGGMDMTGMKGMVDDTTMTRLESLKGVEFDRLWLTSMIGHHEGAIEMSETELTDGTSADAKKLAEQIATVQRAEIAQMKQMAG